jgi:2-haloacid dehalogenase
MIDRRNLLRGSLWSMSGLPFVRGLWTTRAFASSPPPHIQGMAIRALTFDVFGTMVDWRSAIVRDGSELSRRKGFELDWESFAEQWRAGYWEEMNRVRRGEIPWVRLDVLHRHRLDLLLAEFHCGRLTEADKEWLNLVWHRLPAWPDVKSSLDRLRTRFVVAPLSNADLSMLVDISRYAGLTWDCVLSAELGHHFKPDREAYLTAAKLLDLKVNEILMVAAHYDDLEGAHAAGMRTAYLHRPQEWPKGQKMPPRPAFAFDFELRDLNELCGRLEV